MTSTKLRLLLPALVSLCLPVMAQTTPAANRILVPIDESSRVTLRGNVHPLAQARFDTGPAQGSNPTGRIALLLQRSASQQQALTEYLADLQNPGSPNYRKWLTPAQFGTRFGISDSDLATVESWLQAQGFKIEKVPQARNLIQFSGTFDQVQAAFHTPIHTFRVNGQAHFANVSDPQIPAALAPVVAGVGPLNNFHPKSQLIHGPRFHWDAATHRYQPDLTLQDNAGNLYLVVDPADAATIYDSPNSALNTSYSGTNFDGTGINLGIVGNSDLTLGDVQNYREAFLGETSGSVNLPTVVIDGNDPGLSSEADEALLDNEIAGGLAPKAKIYFYTAADTDLTSGLIDSAFRAIDDNTVSILSMSFGQCEANLGSSGNQLIDEAGEQAAAQGISIVVSAGDDGSAGCDDFNTESEAQSGLAVSGFASTPYTIAVGGTDFDGLTQSTISTYVNTTTGSSGTPPYYETAKGPIPEAVWNDSTTTTGNYSANVAAKDSSGNTSIVAGSGGVSQVYAKPSYQTSLTPGDSARDVPDVSLFAADGVHFSFWALCSDSVTDGSTSTYTDCQNGDISTGIEGVGGTSAAAPAFAGMLALISQSQGGKRLGQADYVLYQLAKSNPSAFHDVTTSNNSVPCVTGSPNCGTNGFLTGYNAVSGYDTASGLGSVDLNALVKAWSSAALTSTSTSFNINGSTAAYTGTHGANLTLNVGVNPTSATGNVAIIANANMSTSANSTQNNGQLPIALSGGSGSTTYNGLPGGSYTVYAQYGGDTSDAESKSATIPVTIAAEPSTTTLNAYDTQGNPLSSLSNIAAGDYVFLDAQVEGTAEGSNTQGVATGTVTFYNGSTQLGTAAVNSEYNLASYPPNTDSFLFLPAGNYNITAKYSGDASFNASTSSAISFTIAAASPAITLGSSGNITVSPGATTGNTATISVTPSGGFTGQVKMTCAVTTAISSPNDPPTCSVTTPVTISGTTAATATLTANTTASTSGALNRPLDRFFLGGGATLAMILFFGIPARRRAWRGMLSVVAVAILFIGAAVGCGGGGSSGGGGGGGGGNSGTTAGAYTITITGADAATGKVTATTTVTLTVN